MGCRAFAFFRLTMLCDPVHRGLPQATFPGSQQSKSSSDFLFPLASLRPTVSKGSIQISFSFTFLSQALGILSGASRARSLRYMFLT